MAEPSTPIGGSFHRLIRNMRRQAEKDARAERIEAAAREACDLLAERTHGSPARSPGHNARLVLERALSATAQRDG